MFSLPTGDKLFAFRRGTSAAAITCLSFYAEPAAPASASAAAPEPHPLGTDGTLMQPPCFLVAASTTSTVHVYRMGDCSSAGTAVAPASVGGAGAGGAGASGVRGRSGSGAVSGPSSPALAVTTMGGAGGGGGSAGAGSASAESSPGTDKSEGRRGSVGGSQGGSMWASMLSSAMKLGGAEGDRDFAQVRLRTPAVPCLCAITKEPVSAPGRGTSVGGGSAAASADPVFDFYVMVVTSDAVVHYYRLDVTAGGECRLGKEFVVRNSESEAISSKVIP